MKHLAIAALLILGTTAVAARAPPATCKAQATEKEAGRSCPQVLYEQMREGRMKSLREVCCGKKLSGAAKTSHVKKCVGDTIGS